MNSNLSNSTFSPDQFGVPPDANIANREFQRLCEIIAQLRSPAGCPWDREQTLETIKPHTLEETYELLEAIDSGDNVAIVEELGDVLLQVLLDAQIGADERRFDLIDVMKNLAEKLIIRHPHVFGDAAARNSEEVLKNWDRIKQLEKKRDSIFDGLPKALPSLARAFRLSAKAARVGFDFPNRDMLFDKLREEINELSAELFPGGAIPNVSATVEAQVVPDEPITDESRRQRAKDELGDLLFVMANIARRWDIDPEEALRASNEKFERRVRFIEQRLAAQSRAISTATLAEMEDLYQEGKRAEKTKPT